jgi:hypothetical protein
MKRFTAFTSLLVLGTTLSYLVKSMLSSEEIKLDLSDEEIHLYL